MLEIKISTQFKKDFKKMSRQNKSLILLEQVINQLQRSLPLPIKNRDHALGGDWLGYRECYISPDWLLIYSVDRKLNLLRLARTGSHAELFS